MSFTCLVRHGDRFDSNDYESWKNNPRYKENSHDTPLSDLGFKEILKLEGHVPKIDMIYSSPMTRCVQTAIQLQSFLKVPIRLEYGITEPGRLVDDGHSLPDLINGKFVKLQPDYDEVDGRFFYSNIDEFLYPEALFERYPELDRTYKSFIQPQEHKFMDVLCNYGNRMVKIINYLSQKHDNVLIVGHSGLVTFGATYFTGSASHFKLSQGPNGGGGRKHTGLLVRHDRINKKTDLINPDDL